MPRKKKKSYRHTETLTVAAIDVGSTSSRLNISEIGKDGKLTVIDELVCPVPIGQDTFSVGYIRPKMLRALCSALENFSRLASEYRVDDFRAVATSAIREAANKDLVIDRIRHETGIYLNVIDAVEESRLTCQILMPFIESTLPRSRKHILFMDLGGGSTETLLLKGGNLVLANNRRLGTSRLFQNVISEGGVNKTMFLESVIRNVVNSTLSMYGDFTISECIFSNSLALRAFESMSGVKKVEGGIEIPVEVFNRAIVKVRSLQPEQIAETMEVSYAEVEQFIPTMLTVERLFENLKLKRFFIMDFELLRAVVHDMRLAVDGKNPLLEFSKQVVRSASGIGERFDYDAKHAAAVADISLQIYDELANFLDLSGKDRLYLHTAAILHDIGMFISEEAHHKHSCYLIEWSEIVGFNRDEREMVALIARYHRKALPQSSHGEYKSLNLSDRLRVAKLAAILRVADALDRPHRQLISGISVEIEKERLVITASGNTDLVVERMAMKGKGNLLKDITGLNIELLKR